MKRWLVAVAILLSGAASLSYADYFLIRAVLGGTRNQGDPNQPGQPGGAPGMPGGPGVPGMPGDLAQRGQPPGRGRGNPSPPAPPGAAAPGAGGQRGTIDTTALAVQAIVHVKPRPPVPGVPAALSGGTQVQTKWSAPHYTHLFNDNQTLISRHLGRPNQVLLAPTNHYKAKKENAFKHRTPGGMLELGDYALAHGLVDEFRELFDTLSKEKPDASPAAKALNDAVQAYTTVKAALDKDTLGDDLAQYWKSRLSCRDEASKHYTLLYTASESNPPEVQSRLVTLEQHMREFYFWFALKGQALPMPKEKLVAVLIDQPIEFMQQRSAEDEPLVCDGFYAQRDNLCVFSAQRTDAAFQAFIRQTHPIWQRGFERAKLLDGTEKRKVNSTTPDDFARYQTLALLEKALEEEAELAAVSHEGSRQLFVATGLIPRAVLPPQWLQFGTAAFFETPKGPFIGAPAVESQTAVYPGVGGPSWAYARPFKDLIKRMEAAQSASLTAPAGAPGGGVAPGRGAPGGGAPGPAAPGPAAPGGPMPPGQAALPAQRVPASAAQLLRQVVTDADFNAVLGPNDRQGLFQARTTSWGLCYYLAKSRLPGLMRYFQELAAMPRDLELDGRSKLAAFARAFDIANATQDDIDPAKFEQFAKEWVSTLGTIIPPGVDFGLELPDTAGPGGRPGQPGGQPGAPGGGGSSGGSGNGSSGNNKIG